MFPFPILIFIVIGAACLYTALVCYIRMTRLDPLPLQPSRYDTPLPSATPLDTRDDPFGPIGRLIQEAENRAHITEYPDKTIEWIDSILNPKPQPDMILTVTKNLTQFDREMIADQWRTINEKRRAQGMMVLPDEGTTFMPRDNIPVTHETHSLGGPYRRWIKDVGIVTADTEEKLDRACEVVMREHAEKQYRKYMDVIEEQDKIIALCAGNPSMSIAETAARDKRLQAWDACKPLAAELLDD